MTYSTTIANTVKNRKVLRSHAREALCAYSPVMTWLLLDSEGDLYVLSEPQGQTEYTGSNVVLATTGGFAKSCGEGTVCDEYGNPYFRQKDYLTDLLGEKDYDRLFNQSRLYPDFEGKLYSNTQRPSYFDPY